MEQVYFIDRACKYVKMDKKDLRMLRFLNNLMILLTFKTPVMEKKIFAFTLAEVLITLGIIGVVAAITIPTLMNKAQDIEYRAKYKQAYADISQAFAGAIAEQTLTPRTGWSDAVATASEWAVMKGAFKVAKECAAGHLDECWPPGEKINGAPDTDEQSFIDASGRSWAEYFYLENVYFVDTNGYKGPNQFGKDRWFFATANADEPRLSVGLPDRIGISISGDPPNELDQTTASSICHYPPCYYYTWLFGK